MANNRTINSKEQLKQSKQNHTPEVVNEEIRDKKLDGPNRPSV
ncbi:hypothetical protein [Paenibacillus sp. OAS669]|nr:hypothetical protein [Paenibacillus sp. OAS669]MBE1443977.1 hypothetical protein [Paenibacillus sp. OAS669]